MHPGEPDQATTLCTETRPVSPLAPLHRHRPMRVVPFRTLIRPIKAGDRVLRTQDVQTPSSPLALQVMAHATLTETRLVTLGDQPIHQATHAACTTIPMHFGLQMRT
jgi:hypothetical protein